MLLMEPQPERMAEVGDGTSAASFWHSQITLAGKVEEECREKAVKIVDRYEDQKRHGGTRLNIFHANTEALKPALYSATPRPDVRRRNIHEVPRTGCWPAATVLERALAYCVDESSFTAAMESARDDALIVGRGVVREVYDRDVIRRRTSRLSIRRRTASRHSARPMWIDILKLAMFWPRGDGIKDRKVCP
jgi:hypothetical protein